MKILLYSNNSLFINAIKQNLQGDDTIEFYEDIESLLNAAQPKDIFVLIWDAGLKTILDRLTKAARVFILKPNSQNLDWAKSENVEFIHYPIKLGFVINKLKSYLSHKKQNERLKGYSFCHFAYDPSQNILSDHKSNQSIILTDKEDEILNFLYSKKGTAVARDELLHIIWGYGGNIETHTLETHIYRLRQKVEIDPSKPAIILTNKEGYYLKI